MKVIRITSAAILTVLLGIAVPVYAQHEQQSDKQEQPAKAQTNHEQAKPAQQNAQHEQKPQKAQHAQPQQQKPQQTQRAQQLQKPQNNQQAAQQQKQNKDNQQAAQQQKQNKDKQQAAQQQKQNQNKQQAAQQQKQNQNKQQQAQRAQQQKTQSSQRAAQQQKPLAQTRRQNPSAQQHQVQQTAWRGHRAGNWQSDHRTWQQRGGYHGYRIPDDRYQGYFGSNHGFRIYGLPFMVVGGFPRFQYYGYWFTLVDPWPGDWDENWYDNDDVYVEYVDNGYYLFDVRHPGFGIAINITM